MFKQAQQTIAVIVIKLKYQRIKNLMKMMKEYIQSKMYAVCSYETTIEYPIKTLRNKILKPDAKIF